MHLTAASSRLATASDSDRYGLMEWFDLSDKEHDGGVLEFTKTALELHVYEQDGQRHAMWIDDDASHCLRVEPGQA